MIKHFNHAVEVQTRRVKSGKPGIAKAVRTFARRNTCNVPSGSTNYREMGKMLYIITGIANAS